MPVQSLAGKNNGGSLGDIKTNGITNGMSRPRSMPAFMKPVNYKQHQRHNLSRAGKK